MGFIFSERERKDFLSSVKMSIPTKKDINIGIDLETAFKCGYLDVSRAPLRGINGALQKKNPSSTSVKVRDKCIKEQIIPEVEKLLSSTEDYDAWHRNLCKTIFEYYEKNGYNSFTVGKAQKWVNMSIKYCCIYGYDYQEKLSRYLNKFHIPIDRYIANPIARELKITPPCYKKDNLDTFDANKVNYVWSGKDDYDEYLECQKKIRNKCDSSSPLRWEFEKWQEEKERQEKMLKEKIKHKSK